MCFLGIGALDFSEFWHGSRNPYEVVCDRVKVIGINFVGIKIGEMDQK